MIADRPIDPRPKERRKGGATMYERMTMLLFVFLMCMIDVASRKPPKFAGIKPLKLPTVKPVHQLLDEYKSKVAEADESGVFKYPSMNEGEEGDPMFPDVLTSLSLPPTEGT